MKIKIWDLRGIAAAFAQEYRDFIPGRGVAGRNRFPVTPKSALSVNSGCIFETARVATMPENGIADHPGLCNYRKHRGGSQGENVENGLAEL